MRFEPTVQIWDVAKNQELARVDAAGKISENRFSPDEDWLAFNDGTEVRVFETMGGREVSRMIHLSEVKSLSFSAGDQWLASVDGFMARVWDVRSGQEISRMVHGQDIMSVEFDPAGHRLAVGDSQKVRIVDISNATMASNRILRDRAIHSINFGGSGVWVGAKSLNGNITLWDSDSGKSMLKIDAGPGGHFVAASPDGRWIATMSGTTLGRKRYVTLWDASSGTDVSVVETESIVEDVAFTADSNRLIVGDNLGNVVAWNVVTYIPHPSSNGFTIYSRQLIRHEGTA
jgi:WD40 repeat protein